MFNRKRWEVRGVGRLDGLFERVLQSVVRPHGGCQRLERLEAGCERPESATGLLENVSHSLAFDGP